MTNPSRSASNGRETPAEEKAVMFLNPARAVGTNAASLPPATITSQRPEATSRVALATACVPAAQAVQVFSAGPWRPWRIETAAVGAFAIIIGTRNGETRRSPRSRRIWIWSSRVWMPPMPVPIQTPLRLGSAMSSPACSSAMSAAAMANWVQRSVRRTSLGLSNQGLGSKSWTRRSPSGAGPFRPSQKASTPMPQGATTPSPVTATRRRVIRACRR
jgi:hypothetical protein